MTAGAWTGRLLAAALGDKSWEDTLKPRKGHLLELEWPKSLPALKRGLMEIGYTKVRPSPLNVQTRDIKLGYSKATSKPIGSRESL